MAECMDGKKSIRISQCMIVKNEEEKLERALSWAKGIVQEQIVVDTGSSDHTVELAKRLGAKVYHFPWIDDFSAARNFALDHASGNWIMTLDADEYPAQGTAEKIFPVLVQAARKNYDGVYGAIMELDANGTITASGTRIRFFRNLPNLRYHRRIHEQLGFTDGHEMFLADACGEISFFHDGYAEQGEAKKNRNERNIRLLKQELAERPDDYIIMGYLGDEYLGGLDEDMEEAKAWYLRSVEHMPQSLPVQDQRSAYTFSNLISIYLAQHDWNSALALYGQATKLLEDEADFDYLLGNYCVSKERWEEAVQYFTRGLAILERYGTCNRSMMISVNLEGAYVNLALSCLRLGRLKEAVQTTVSVLKARPYNMKALYILLEGFKNDNAAPKDCNYAKSVAAFLQKLYQFSNLKDRLFAARAAREAGWEELALIIEKGVLQ